MGSDGAVQSRDLSSHTNVLLPPLMDCSYSSREAVQGIVEMTRSGIRFMALSFVNDVFLGNSHNLYVPQFPHLKQWR